MPRKRKEPTTAGFYIRTEATTRKCALMKHMKWDSLLPAIKEWVIHVSRISRRGSLYIYICKYNAKGEIGNL
eukprot:575973-Hanusia_phi.AAC.2